MEVEGRSGTRVCGRDHLDMGCDTISRWLKTRVRHVRPVSDHSGVFVLPFNPLVQGLSRIRSHSNGHRLQKQTLNGNFGK